MAIKERTESQMVLVVDDDPSVRKALTYLFESMELPVKAFTMASELLDGKLPDVPRCLVLDIRLPGGSGLDCQEALAKTGIQIPIVFLTAYGDIPMSVKAMKAGAVDFLTKPFRDQDMLDAVTRALNQDRKRRAGEKKRCDLRQRFETLTPREREVMALVASGLRNKQIAYQLQVEEITVKIHRGRAMKRMEARSLADLVCMAEMLGIRRTA
ncbi:response regulator [Bradyrhizobium sp. CB82]|uniref:response regulator transcription factor n=1 Tax=Bradyrhizobium sp. CB82 TaxID=3039159 RepID=UPI0024B201FD|nr:response regulator [Bradyrhizobium sp. CB82]WFU39142.1 response regulator [Bradyrhizobium sp. CB82]